MVLLKKAVKFLNHLTLRPNSDFMVLYFVLHSTHYKGKTIPRNYRSQSISSLEKWQKFLNHLILRSNSDFMVPFFALYSTRTISSNLMVLLKNDRKVS